MRAISILGAFVVLLVNISISYNHSLELFREGGFTGWMAHTGVIGIETTFIIGALYIITCRMRGVSPGVPAYLAGLQGLLLVTWSNVSAGWEKLNDMLPVPVGVILGFQIPLSLIIMEAMLSREILGDERTSKEVEKPSEKNSESHEVGRGMRESTSEEPHKKDEKTRTPLEVAEEFFKEHGYLPTIKQLEKLAQTTEWKARKALSKLRSKYENTASSISSKKHA